MVELCPSRIHILKLDEKTLLEEAKNFNLAKVCTKFQLCTHLMLTINALKSY